MPDISKTLIFILAQYFIIKINKGFYSKSISKLIWFSNLDSQIDSVDKFMTSCTPSSKDYFFCKKVLNFNILTGVLNFCGNVKCHLS